jgi:hypothetical protein
MIAAGFLPACTAAWHRGVLELVRAGWWHDLPGADRWSPEVWLAGPAALITALAILAAVTARVRLLLVLLGISGLVHPWLVVALAPLALAVRTWPAMVTLRRAMAIAALTWLAALWLTPDCASPASSWISASTVAGVLWPIVGLGGAALVAIDMLGGDARREQMAALALIVVAGSVLASGRATDATALLGASAAALWWRVTSGARHVVAWQTTAAGRLGAAALVLVVPVLAAGRVHLPAPEEYGAAALWAALEAAGSPAAVMSTGGRADTATTIWRSGPSDAQQSLATIPPDPDATSRYLATSAVYAWSESARTLAARGMLVAPVPAPDQPRPLLWRVLQFERCHVLTTGWVDISLTATGGQFAGNFPVAEANRGALLYLGSTRALVPRALDWPPDSTQGLDARVFDREADADRTALAGALGRDALPAAALGDARFVTRVRFDRRGTAPETLPVMLGGVAATAWARRYVPGDPRPDRQPSICRSSVGQPITAYAGAPAVLPLDLASPHTVGGGWHAAERAGDDAFRWTQESADLLFVAHRAQALVLRLDAQPGTGDWASAAMRVTLNGAEARCREGAPPCEWLLPADAMRTGLNVITLHSETVAAPPPDPRRLGLLVRRAEIARP